MTRLYILAVTCAACAVAVGGNVDASPRTQKVPTFRRTIERVASMDPLRAASVCDAAAMTLVYEPPLDVDYYARPYKLRPGLCSMPVISEDRLVYTFTIREGARFHPDPCFGANAAVGREVTSADMVYSLERLGSKANASSGMWLMADVAKVEAVDGRTVKITLKKPLHVFPWLMAMPYAGVHPHEAVEMYGTKFGGHPVGSGPYRLAEWWRNHRMTFERVSTWRGWNNPEDCTSRLPDGTPATGAVFDRLEFFVVDDESTKWLMFLGGEVDFLGGISNNNWDAVVGPNGELAPDLVARGIRLHGDSTIQVMYAGFNMDDPLLKNRKLRQALNCAFDFPAWKKFYNNRLEPANGPVPIGVDGRLETPFQYSFNLEKAKKLLAEAGYPGGIDPKTGRRLELSITLGRATQDAREQTELLASFYNRIGIKLDARYMTWDAYLKAVNDGRVSIFFLGWVGDYPDAENFLQLFHSKNVSPGANHGNYRNPEYDKVYDKAMAAKTVAERNEAWRQAQEIVREDCPWLFLHFPKAYTLTRGHLQGYKPTDFPYCIEKHLRYAP